MSSANIAVCVARENLKSARAAKGLVRALSAVPDFRMDRRRRHILVTILAIGVLCMLSCGSSFRDMEAYGRKFRQRLSGFLPMAGGVPSHDTFGRVLSKLPPESLVQGLGVWLRAVAGRTDGQAVSFDGKAVRRAWQSRDVSWFEDRAKWRDLAGFVMIETSCSAAKLRKCGKGRVSQVAVTLSAHRVMCAFRA